MEWYLIAADQVPVKDGIRRIKIKGKHICLIRTGGQLFATSSKCPHAGADLATGWCEKGRIICPYHRHAFDLQTGRGDPGQGNYIRVYPLEERAGAWFIGFTSSWFTKLFS